MQSAVIGDVNLEYEVAGAGEPVVLIHGGFIADAFWPLLAEPELTDQYQLIAYHRRGYAGSSTSGSADIAHQAADCIRLLRHLGVERAHVVGHSLGGVIALQLALDAPQAVQTLALLEPALMLGSSGQAYRDSLVQAERQYREFGAESVVDRFLTARHGPQYRTELDRILPGAFEQAVADAGAMFDLDLPGLLNWHFGEAEARRIAQPVLSVIGGESNALSPRFVETHRLLLEWLPHVEGSVVPDAAHGLQMQNPRGTAQALAGFFVRHPIGA